MAVTEKFRGLRGFALVVIHTLQSLIRVNPFFKVFEAQPCTERS